MGAQEGDSRCLPLIAARWLALLAMLSSACGEAADRAAAAASGTTIPVDEIVARIDGDPISMAEVLGSLPRSLSARSEGARRRAVDAVVTRHLAAREAHRRGLDAEPAVRAELERARREAAVREEAILRDALARSLSSEIELTEEDLREHHRATRLRYGERRVRLRRSALGTGDDAAAFARAEPSNPADGASGETIGPVPVTRLPASLLPEAAGLVREGDRVVIDRGGASFLVELIEVRHEPRPFEEVRDRVEQSLRALRGQQAFRARINALREDARVEIDAGKLAEDARWMPRKDAHGSRADLQR